MNRKEARIGLRLTEEELIKVEQIATLRGCTLSEAVRLMVRGTQVKTVAIVEINPPMQNALAVA